MAVRRDAVQTEDPPVRSCVDAESRAALLTRTNLAEQLLHDIALRTPSCRKRVGL